MYDHPNLCWTCCSSSLLQIAIGLLVWAQEATPAGVLQVCKKDESPHTAFWAAPELRQLLEDEQAARCQLWHRGESTGRVVVAMLHSPAGLRAMPWPSPVLKVSYLCQQYKSHVWLTGLAGVQAATKQCECLPSSSRLPARATIPSVRSARCVSLHSMHPGSVTKCHHPGRCSAKTFSARQMQHFTAQPDCGGCGKFRTNPCCLERHPGEGSCAGHVPPVLGVLRLLPGAAHLPEPCQPAVRVSLLPVDPGMAALPG